MARVLSKLSPGSGPRPSRRPRDIPLATAEHVDPRDSSGFLGDGHYRPEIDRMFAERLREILPP